jgi:hypothetical protein
MAKNTKMAPPEERYQTFSLFDKKSANDLLTGLSLAVSLTIQDRRKLGLVLDQEDVARREKRDSEREQTVAVIDRCAVCSVSFQTVEEWRQHLKLDWHLYNAKRKTKGLGPLSADEFAAVGEADGEDGETDVFSNYYSPRNFLQLLFFQLAHFSSYFIF